MRVEGAFCLMRAECINIFPIALDAAVVFIMITQHTITTFITTTLQLRARCTPEIDRQTHILPICFVLTAERPEPRRPHAAERVTRRGQTELLRRRRRHVHHHPVVQISHHGVYVYT